VELGEQWSNRLSSSGIELSHQLEWKRGELTHLIARLYQEFREPDNATPLSAEGLTLEILASFSRQSLKTVGVFDPPWLRRAKSILHDRFAESLTLDGIAGEVGIHPVHLARTFRRRFSLSVGEYQRQLRVKYAADQLASTRLPIAAIALAAGFADQAHFSRVFKTHTGFTPKRFRAMFDRG
jgi:AraC family transcriptional regulator